MIRYLELYKQYLLVERGLSINTVDNYISDIKGYFKVDEKGDVNKYLEYLYNKNIKTSSLNRKITAINGYYNYLFNNKFIEDNIFLNVDRPKREKKLPVYLTYGEMLKFINNIKENEILEKAIIEIMYGCGLRVSEALALTRGDINLRDNRITIRRTLTKDEKGRVMMGKTTKTYAGRRMIPLPEFLKDTIIEQMQVSEEFKNNDENLLFKPDDKQYVDRVNVNTELKRLLKRHFGIDDITTHSLRHTYGTRCIEAGVAPVVVQKMMGHTDVSITLNTYTSVFDKFKEKEIEKVNKYYMEENMLNAVKLLQYNENKDFDDIEDTKEL